jgi:alpha-L-rhamnosidase
MTPFSPYARWIWSGTFRTGSQQHVVFCHHFVVPDSLEFPRLKIAAQRDYEARLNCRLLGRGSLSDPHFQRFDTYDVADFLTAGENELRILVYTDGGHFKTTPWPEAHGLLCEMEDRRKVFFSSDETWKVRVHRGWRQPHANFDDTTWPEIFDANLDEPEWFRENNSPWEVAAPLLRKNHLLWGSAIPQARFFPFVHLVPNEIPQLSVSKLFPASLLALGEVLEKCEPSSLDVAVRMSLERIHPVAKVRIENAENLLLGSDGAEIENSDIHEAPATFTGLRNATIILDFGEILNGRPNIKVTAGAGAVLDIGYASVQEDGSIQPYRSWRTPQADQYTCKSGRQEWQTFQWRQFRYLQITFRRLSVPLKLHEVSVEKSEYAFEETGSFSCDHEIFKQAVDMCRKSATLCSMDHTMDNASRERRQYMGLDCSAIVLAIHQFFGNPPLVKKYFRQLCEGQQATGHFRYSNPGHTHDESSLFDHSLSLPIILQEHYLHYGDVALVQSVGTSLLRFLEFCLTCTNDEGMATLPPYSIWFDWADIERKDDSFLLNAVLWKSLGSMILLIDAAGISSPSLESARGLLPKLRCHLQTKWFHTERGAFADTTNVSGPSDAFSEHGNSVAILWEIASREQTSKIIENFRKTPKLFAPASPGWTYMPAALFRAGAADLALQWITDHVDPLLRQGVSSWPETWCLYGENTLGSWRSRDSRAIAQAAGLGASYAAFRELAGVRPIEPGMKCILLAPRPGVIRHFEVSFPVPGGLLKFQYSLNHGGAKYRVSSDVPLRVLLSLPFDGDAESLSCTGAIARESRVGSDASGLSVWEGMVLVEGSVEIFIAGLP